MEEYDKGIGLIGEADRINEFISVGNAYNHPNFNSKVDIETSMPVYVIAVKDTSLPVLLEVVNRKGIRSVMDNNKLDWLDKS